MKTVPFILTIFFCWPLVAIEKFSDKYLVTYGSERAPISIIQYYSLTCPHCVALFRKQFQQIKDDYINTEKISWVLHPVPMDLLTVQAMDCLQKLSPREKKIFLEAILEEVLIDKPKFSANFLKKGMEVLGKPIPELHEQSYLSETDAYMDAFNFLKQEETIKAVPSVEVNGTFLPGQIPDIDFINNMLFELGGSL